MSGTGPVVTLSPQDYDAVLFDLDGVLTRTASVHAAAWKKLFDAFLEQRAADTGVAFVPFDIDADYRRYVDAKPRYDGVTAFLESRGIESPFGAPEDAPDAQTVRALGKLKDRYFTQHLEQQASSSMKRRSRWCVRSGRTRSGPRSCPPATTALRCSRQSAYRTFSTREWTGRISPAWVSTASRPPMLSWRRRSALTWMMNDESRLRCPLMRIE